MALVGHAQKIHAEGPSGPGGRQGMAVVVFVLAVVAFVRTSNAQEHQRMNVVLAGEPSAADRVLSVLQESLARQGLDLVAVVVPRMDPRQLIRAPIDRPPSGPVVHLWLDLVARQPTMYLLSASSGLVYVRPLAVRSNPDAVGVELIRFVVDSSVQAILNGRSLGVSRDEFEKSLDTVPTAPTAVVSTTPEPPVAVAPPARRWAITGAYFGTLLTSGFIQHGPQIAVELRMSHLHVGIILLQDLPLTVTRAEVNTHLISSGLRVVAALPIALGAGWLGSVGVGAGIDVTRVAPEGTGATPAFWVSDPLIRAATALEHTFGAMIASLHIGVDCDLLAARYAALGPDGTADVWTPHRVRPFADLRVGIVF